jgi:hypothetical protein
LLGAVAVRVLRLAVELEAHKGIVDLKRIENGTGLIEFVIQYRILHANAWVPVVRYDNCHGAAHVHRFWRTGSAIRRLLPIAVRGSIGAALDWAEADLTANWRNYRHLMIGKLSQQSYQVDRAMEE